MGSLPTHSESTKLISIRKLTATLCLTFAVLLGSEVRGSDLPPCPSDQTKLYHNCFGRKIYGTKSERVLPNTKYVGEWMHDAWHGQGTETNDLFKWKYVGEFKNGKRHGQGNFTYANGRVWEEGIWKNGNCQKITTTFQECC